MPVRRTAKTQEPPAPIYDYGCWKKGLDQFTYDRYAFANRIPIDQGAPTRPELFKKLAKVILPDHFEWHEWTNRIVESACHYSLIGNMGCSNSAKTFNWAGFAVIWWLAYPEESSVTFVSTSIKSMRRRGWAEVQKCHTSIPGPRQGNFVDSKMLWQCFKGDDKHAIIGKAVEEGPIHKVAADIIGVHTKRQMIIIDEANAVPEAIWEAIPNLYSYPEEFILVALANPRDRLSVFSRFCEPENGWTSVGVDTEEWDGKPQPHYGNRPVRVIRFDAEKSPNIVEGKLVSKHLPTKEKVEAARAGSGGQTPSYWTNFRGFPPPEGLTKTVFSESTLIRMDAFGSHKFTGRNFSIIGAFDPAFGGGDRPALRFARLGEVTGGEMGIQVMPPILIPISADSKTPVHFQLAEKVRLHCARIGIGSEAYSCPPENFAVDASGEGGGLADIFWRTWSPSVMRIEFGGRASEDQCSYEDVRPANEVYDLKTTEMHFRTRDAVNSGQLKGIDKETAIELCNREFDDSGKRICLMKKKDYRLKFGKSPDLGDCFVAGTLVATPDGPRPIESINIGDSVCTPFGNTTVGRVIKDVVSELTEVHFSDGSSLVGKGKHKVFTWNDGWVRLDCLSLTNTVESHSDIALWQFLNSLFTRDESTEFKHLVDIIRTKTGAVRLKDFYTELSDGSTTGLFLSVCAFIIKMVIGQTTRLPIWNWLKGVSTHLTICVSDFWTRHIERETLMFSRMPLKKLHYGINLVSDESGTLKMLQWRGRIKLKRAECVPSVGKRSSIISDTERKHVPTNVGKRSPSIVTSLIKHVLSVAASIVRASTHMGKVVPSRVRTFTTGKPVEVFNLTLNEHNVYYANGLLVQNCLVMLLEVARRKGFKLAPVGQTVHIGMEFNKVVEQTQEVYLGDGFEEEEYEEEFA